MLVIFVPDTFGQHTESLDVRWNSYGFAASRNDYSESFTLPLLGENSVLRPGSLLFPGTTFGPPINLPFGVEIADTVKSIEDRKAEVGFWLNIELAEAYLRKPQNPGSINIRNLDLKGLASPGDPQRYVLEDAVNFSYGIVTRVAGLSNETANYLAGAIALAIYAKNGKLAPYGGIFSRDRGDDPKGSVHIELGQEYYNSGQYMYDFFARLNSTYNIPGYRFDEYYSQRTPEWVEANSRLAERINQYDSDIGREIRRDIWATQLQRKAIESAQESGRKARFEYLSLQARIFAENMEKIQADAAKFEFIEREKARIEQKKKSEEDARKAEEDRAKLLKLAEEIRIAREQEEKKADERRARMTEDERANDTKLRRAQDEARMADEQRRKQEEYYRNSNRGSGSGGASSTPGIPNLPLP